VGDLLELDEGLVSPHVGRIDPVAEDPAAAAVPGAGGARSDPRELTYVEKNRAIKTTWEIGSGETELRSQICALWWTKSSVSAAEVVNRRTR